MEKSNISTNANSTENGDRQPVRRTPMAELQPRRKSRKTDARRRTPGPGHEESVQRNHDLDKQVSGNGERSVYSTNENYAQFVSQGREHKLSVPPLKMKNIDLESAAKLTGPVTRSRSQSPGQKYVAGEFPSQIQCVPGKTEINLKSANQSPVRFSDENRQTVNPLLTFSLTPQELKKKTLSVQGKYLEGGSPVTYGAEIASINNATPSKIAVAPEIGVKTNHQEPECFPKMVDVDVVFVSKPEENFEKLVANKLDFRPVGVKEDLQCTDRAIRKFCEYDENSEDDGRPRIRQSFLENLKETLAKNLIAHEINIAEKKENHRVKIEDLPKSPAESEEKPGRPLEAGKISTSNELPELQGTDRKLLSSGASGSEVIPKVENAEEKSTATDHGMKDESQQSKQRKVTNEADLRNRRAQKRIQTGLNTDTIDMPYSFNQKVEIEPGLDLNDDSESDSYTMSDAMFRAPPVIKLTAGVVGVLMFLMVLLALQSRFSVETLFAPQIWMPRIAVAVVVVLIGGLVYGQLTKKKFVRKLRTDGKGSRSKPFSPANNIYTRERIAKML